MSMPSKRTNRGVHSQPQCLCAPGRGGGTAGSQGPTGPPGAKGDTGDQGLQGIQGAKGDKGDKGDPRTGLDSTYVKIAQISWTHNGTLSLSHLLETNLRL